MFSNAEVRLLLSLPKIAKVNVIDLSKQKTIIQLTSESEEELLFRLHIWNSKKIKLKLTCHHDAENIGLLRLDYHGGHKNPDKISEFVPEQLHPYIGFRFPRNMPHIHLYVQDYDLNWAMPLVEHEFPVKDVKSYRDIEKAIRCFQKEISLKTRLIIQLPTY